jgi:hypothetical protein
MTNAVTGNPAPTINRSRDAARSDARRFLEVLGKRTFAQPLVVATGEASKAEQLRLSPRLTQACTVQVLDRLDWLIDHPIGSSTSLRLMIGS